MLRFLLPRARPAQVPAGRRSRSFALGLFIGVCAVLLYETLPPPALPVPPDEAAFIRAITAARLAYMHAPNDLARLPLRSARAAAICAAIPSLALTGWTGRLTGAEPNSLPDLLGQTTIDLRITIAPHITLETATSPLSNLPGTLLSIGSPLAATAATIPIGHPVTLSGELPPSNADCATETSLILVHSMTDPSFKLVISALRAR
jgi:hypothetical protein